MEDVPATIKFDKHGVASATLNYSCKWAVAADLVRDIESHPDFEFLKRKDATIKREEAELAKVTINFEGIDPETNDGEGVRTYAVKGGTSETPITAHPWFEKIAGTGENPNKANGATWEQGPQGSWSFKEFGVTRETVDEEGGVNVVRNPIAGVTSYAEGGLTFQETYTKGFNTVGEREKADLQKLGYIDEPPEVDKYVDFGANSKRNWLLISCNIDDVGDGIKVTKEWRASGINGWFESIYEEGKFP